MKFKIGDIIRSNYITEATFKIININNDSYFLEGTRSKTHSQFDRKYIEFNFTIDDTFKLIKIIKGL